MFKASMQFKSQVGESFIPILLIMAVVGLSVTPGGRDFMMEALHSIATFFESASTAVSQASG